MTITNGDATKATIATTGEFLDPSTALEVLSQYENGDGISIHELADTKKNGGLTYNDFLVLPG